MVCRILFFFFALLGAMDSASALNHYVRTNAPVNVQGKLLPPGSYVQIEYDGGDSWLTSDFVDADRISKSAATLVEELLFSPAIDATTNQRTNFYDSAPLLVGDASTLRRDVPRNVENRRAALLALSR